MQMLLTAAQGPLRPVGMCCVGWAGAQAPCCLLLHPSATHRHTGRLAHFRPTPSTHVHATSRGPPPTTVHFFGAHHGAFLLFFVFVFSVFRPAATFSRGQATQSRRHMHITYANATHLMLDQARDPVNQLCHNPSSCSSWWGEACHHHPQVLPFHQPPNTTDTSSSWSGPCRVPRAAAPATPAPSSFPKTPPQGKRRLVLPVCCRPCTSAAT